MKKNHIKIRYTQDLISINKKTSGSKSRVGMLRHGIL